MAKTIVHYDSTDARFCGAKDAKSNFFDKKPVDCPACLQETRLASNPMYPGMTNLALLVQKVEEAVPGKYEADNFMKIWDAQEKLIAESNDKAIAAGTLIGRTIRSQVADGYAVYEVCWVKGQHAFLRHIRIGDGYRARDIEELAEVFGDPLDAKGVIFQVTKRFVENRCRQEEALAAMFKKRSN